jgi:hypothetical protein
MWFALYSPSEPLKQSRSRFRGGVGGGGPWLPRDAEVYLNLIRMCSPAKPQFSPVLFVFPT